MQCRMKLLIYADVTMEIMLVMGSVIAQRKLRVFCWHDMRLWILIIEVQQEVRKYEPGAEALLSESVSLSLSLSADVEHTHIHTHFKLLLQSPNTFRDSSSQTYNYSFASSFCLNPNTEVRCWAQSLSCSFQFSECGWGFIFSCCVMPCLTRNEWLTLSFQKVVNQFRLSLKTLKTQPFQQMLILNVISVHALWGGDHRPPLYVWQTRTLWPKNSKI